MLVITIIIIDMGKIYRGETLNMVFRCFRKDGVKMGMEDKDVSVLLRDGFGEVVYRFSTLVFPGVKVVKVKDNYVVCRLTEEDMSVLEGRYTIEVKVTYGDLVMIDMVKGIRVSGSVIGEEVEL